MRRGPDLQEYQPLDIVFDAIRDADGGRNGVVVSIEQVTEAVAASGLTAGMVMEAIENWVSIGVMDVGPDTVALHPGVVESPPRVASQPPAENAGHEAGARPVALLSVFDGTGMARLGMDDLLRMAGAPQALTNSAFVELNDELAHAVGEQWRARAALGTGIPHSQIARDVWDLVRGGRETTARYASCCTARCPAPHSCGLPLPRPHGGRTLPRAPRNRWTAIGALLCCTHGGSSCIGDTAGCYGSRPTRKCRYDANEAPAGHGASTGHGSGHDGPPQRCR